MGSKFDQRSDSIEIMDDLHFEGDVMDQTLRELEIINKWLGGNQVTISGLNKLYRLNNKPSKLRIVDLGCGGADMLKLIADWARKKNIEVDLIGIDANPYVIQFAKANTNNYPEISLRCLNVFSDEFKQIEADIFTATLFLHHLSDKELSGFLQQLMHQARLGIVINDLHRHWFAYYSIKWLTALFSKSTMVQHDAAVSVLRSFKKKELIETLHQISVPRFTLRWKWAFRWETVLIKG